MLRIIALAAASLGIVLFATAGSGAAVRPATLRADLAEWSIVPSGGVVRSGAVRIVARNLGVQRHELILVRTRSFAATLPLQGSRALATSLAPRIVVAPGQSRSLVIHLAPGSYELVDNLPWHYWHGAHAAFVVR